jgi:hypothetical protein
LGKPPKKICGRAAAIPSTLEVPFNWGRIKKKKQTLIPSLGKEEEKFDFDNVKKLFESVKTR